MKLTGVQPRAANGKYESNDWGAMCTCGHTIGVHTAAGSHECLECAGAYICDGFSPSRKRSHHAR